MGQALYRKYRSKSLKEIVGQEHITRTLDNALRQGRISHAYLFTGPRGVGKTSIARILAHEINGLAYTDDSQHMDIIEIDAASNRRIDEIRELRDKVYVAPTSAKYKVYIIDEVHMLTREAFNALLKTLEEPPAHVVFILATTDAHKLPETIVSRTQRFSFKPAADAQTIELLRKIAKAEKLDVSDEALQLLAEHGAGSYRDSVSLLDQTGSHTSKIEVEDVRQVLGIPADEALEELLSLTVDGGTAAELMQALEALYAQGYQAAAIAKRQGQLLRLQLSRNSATFDTLQTLKLLRQLIEVPASYDPERLLEITLLQFQTPMAVAEPVEQPKAEAPKPPQEPINKSVSTPKGSKSLGLEAWEQVLQTLKQRHNTLYGVLRMAQPDFSDPAKLKLAFGFSFHQRRLLESSNRQKLAEIVTEITGQDVIIECLVDKNAIPFKANDVEPPIASSQPPPGEPEDLAAISNIFGNAELLES